MYGSGVKEEKKGFTSNTIWKNQNSQSLNCKHLDYTNDVFIEQWIDPVTKGWCKDNVD